MIPDELRAEYDQRVLDVKQRIAKAEQLRRALGRAGLWLAPAKILDVGCGSALILDALDAPNALKFGCDIRVGPFLHSNVDRAQVIFVQGDARRLPFRECVFDLVVCLAVIEELAEWRESLEAMARCVAPGGVLYVTMTNGKTLTRWYSFANNVGIRVHAGWWFYAKSSLRLLGLPARGFGLDVFQGWRYVNVTPHLARATLPISCAVPVPLLAWLLKWIAPSFAYAWQRPPADGTSK